MKRFFALSLLMFSLTACDKPAESTGQTNQGAAQCAKDTDCKGERICESGQCVNPNTQASLATNPKPPVNLVPPASLISQCRSRVAKLALSASAAMKSTTNLALAS